MRAALFVSLTLLAACDQSPQVSLENASPQEVAAKMKESGVAKDLRKPGKWSYETQIVDFQAPGANPEMLAGMKQAMGAGQKIERCVTAEEIAKVDSFVGSNNANCTFEKFEVGNGKMTGISRCAQGGITQNVKMDGQYTADSSDMTITSTTSGGPAAAANATIKMNIKSKRIGDC